MKRSYKRAAFAATVTMLLTSCGASSPGKAIVHVDQVPGIVMASSQLHGQKSLTINLQPAKEASFQAKSVIHRWVANDVFEYRVVLRMKQPSGSFADFNPPLVVTCPQKGGTPVTQATFTDLKQGMVYQAELEAWGNGGGTAASQRLNIASRSLATFDFTAANDVEDTVAASLAVAFDPVAFNGSANVSVQIPTEGTYTNPTTDRPTATTSGTSSSGTPAPSPTPSAAPDVAPLQNELLSRYGSLSAHLSSFTQQFQVSLTLAPLAQPASGMSAVTAFLTQATGYRNNLLQLQGQTQNLLNQAQADLTNAQNQLSSTTSSLNSYQFEYSYKQNQLSSYQAELSYRLHDPSAQQDPNNQARINELQTNLIPGTLSRLSELQNLIASLQAQASSLQNQISVLSGKLQAGQSFLSHVNSDLGFVQSAISTLQ